MRNCGPVRSLVAMVGLLIFIGSAWAEICKGSKVKVADLAQFDQEVFRKCTLRSRPTFPSVSLRVYGSCRASTSPATTRIGVSRSGQGTCSRPRMWLMRCGLTPSVPTAPDDGRERHCAD